MAHVSGNSELVGNIGFLNGGVFAAYVDLEFNAEGSSSFLNNEAFCGGMTKVNAINTHLCLLYALLTLYTRADTVWSVCKGSC